MVILSDSEWLNFFSRLYIWATLAAVFSAGVALLASKGMQIYSDRLSLNQNREIAQAQSGAASAHERAATADERAALATERAAVAGNSAAQANSRAAQLEVDAEVARTKQRELEAETAKSRKEQEELKKQNLELESQLEKERIARLQIEEKIAPRTLSPTQEGAIARTVASLPNQTITVMVPLGLPEPISYAGAIKQAIEKGGWHVDGLNQGVYTPTVPTGVFVRIKDRKVVPRAADVLMAALVAAGINARGEEVQTLQPGQVELLIGVKP